MMSEKLMIILDVVESQTTRVSLTFRHRCVHHSTSSTDHCVPLSRDNQNHTPWQRCQRDDFCPLSTLAPDKHRQMSCTIAGAKGGSRKNENGAKRRSGGRKSPVGSRGKAPVEDLGDEVPQKPGVFFCILIVNLTVFRYNSLYIYIFMHQHLNRVS